MSRIFPTVDIVYDHLLQLQRPFATCNSVSEISYYYKYVVIKRIINTNYSRIIYQRLVERTPPNVPWYCHLDATLFSNTMTEIPLTT